MLQLQVSCLKQLGYSETKKIMPPASVTLKNSCGRPDEDQRAGLGVRFKIEAEVL